jgi:cyclopropane-fatty-acyl-phospholipid synthase
VMLLHTIVRASPEELQKRGLELPGKLLRFILFIMDEIFPGGELPMVTQVEQHATNAGFRVARIQALGPHYARTLDIWAATLQSHREQAIAVQSEEVYQRYMKYLTGCADLFRDGYTDVCQFTLVKNG